jgi:spermidine/putrescine transport system substrate-binding protein
MIDVAQLCQAMRMGRIRRREFVQLLAGSALAASIGVGGRGAWAADTALVFTWAGYDDPEFYKKFIDKYGAPPQFTLWADEEEGLEKLRAGFKADVVFPCAYKVAKWYEAGVLGEIDTSKIAAFDDIFPSLRDIDASVQDGKRVWVPLDWGQTSVIYRTDLAPEYVDNETWGILWDEKYKGHLGLHDSLTDGAVVAGIMAGLEDPFDYRSEEALAKTREKLEEIVPLLRTFVSDPTSLEQGLASGELVATTAWNESLVRLKEQGVPVKFMEPKEGAMTWVCGMSITADTALADQAHDVIDAILTPEARLYEMRNFGYGSSTQAPYALLSEEELAALGMPPDPEAVLSAGILQRPIQNEQGLQRMFEEVRAATN